MGVQRNRVQLRVITFDSGACGAWIWFERPKNPACPFKDHCGAYFHKAPPPSDDG